jgi:hypothetical protein
VLHLICDGSLIHRELNVVEQEYPAVLEVLSATTVT